MGMVHARQAVGGRPQKALEEADQLPGPDLGLQRAAQPCVLLALGVEVGQALGQFLDARTGSLRVRVGRDSHVILRTRSLRWASLVHPLALRPMSAYLGLNPNSRRRQR